jgi:hypothetical protein
MLLDNLFSTLGQTGTSIVLFLMTLLISVPAAATVMCPKSPFVRRHSDR